MVEVEEEEVAVVAVDGEVEEVAEEGEVGNRDG